MALPAASLELLFAELQALRKDVARLSSRREVALLSRRAAAQLLGIDRGTTLESLIRAGHLRLTLGKIARSEIERLLRDGIPETKRRVPRVAANDEAGAIRALKV